MYDILEVCLVAYEIDVSMGMYTGDLTYVLFLLGEVIPVCSESLCRRLVLCHPEFGVKLPVSNTC